MEYIINEILYIQKPLVNGQLKQLSLLLEDLDFTDVKTATQFLKAIGDKLIPATAIILIPEGESARSKNNEKIANELEWDLSLELQIKIIEDFLSINQIVSLIDKLQGIMTLNPNLPAK